MDDATLLGSASLPRDQGTLYLFSQEDRFLLTTDPSKPGWVDASSQLSRQALAQLPAKIIAKRFQPKVLMSGFGLGYTLVELLKQINLQASIVVSEWLPEVQEWHRGELGKPLGFPIDDPRVNVNDLDIARILRAKQQRFDAILLDTDNGPEDLIFKENDWLYTFSGLSACFEALEPMGVLAIWSPVASETLKGKLVRAGFMVEQRNVQATADSTAQHVIWIAEKLQQD
ncbi:MAG: hypothetical protein ACPG47_10560 [Leucothrix sp.]